MNMQLVIVIVVAALTGAASGLIGQRLLGDSPKLAVIDPTVLVAEQIQKIKPGLDDAEIQARGQAYAKQLDSAIAQVAHEYNVIVLVKPAVITGAHDLTEEVRRRINETP